MTTASRPGGIGSPVSTTSYISGPRRARPSPARQPGRARRAPPRAVRGSRRRDTPPSRPRTPRRRGRRGRTVWCGPCPNPCAPSLPVQRDLDLRAARQTGGRLRHDDVAVRAGEDGEQRRRAEERGGDALVERDLHDVEAPRGGGKVAGQPGADRRLRRRGGGPPHEPGQGAPREGGKEE